MIDANSEEMIAQQAATIDRLDDASIPDPDRPVIPMTILYTIVAGLVSGLIGVATAFLAAHFDHTLRSTWDAERFLGVPVVGSIKRRGRRLIVPRKA
jgi:capsular polysaccharide biosynthesis protein